ncbi:MAG TPA: ATP-binding protein [Chitinophagaceae bacterium]|nr:ATP-binding protein [Chitinophagaceae bacterium]
MQLSAILLIIIIVQIRKHLSRNDMLPDLQALLKKGIVVVAVLFILTNIDPIKEVVRVIIDALLLLSIYIVYKREELKSYRNVMYAYIPFIILSVIKHLTTWLPESWENEIETYVDAATAFAIIWLVAMVIIANKQNKALKTEQQKREEEEKMKRMAEEKKAELEVLVAERTREILKQKEELQQAVEHLKATQDQLIQAEKMASLGELTAGIAHEIQNPLNFVNNFSEVNLELAEELKEDLDKMALKEEDKTHLITIVNNIRQNQDKINYHGKRADSIVKGMLQHSRKGTGQKEPVDLNEMVDEYVRLSYHGLRAKDKGFNATIDLKLDPAITKVQVLPQDMGRALLNIINNAFYAVNEKKSEGIEGYTPTLRVTTRLIDLGKKWIYITIRDNGNGIPDNVKDKVFQPFFTTKPTGKGTGLGLSLSYDIITQGHGGQLKMTSKEGEFTEFVIKLPCS